MREQSVNRADRQDIVEGEQGIECYALVHEQVDRALSVGRRKSAA